MYKYSTTLRLTNRHTEVSPSLDGLAWSFLGEGQEETVPLAGDVYWPGTISLRASERARRGFTAHRYLRLKRGGVPLEVRVCAAWVHGDRVQASLGLSLRDLAHDDGVALWKIIPR